MFAWNKTFYFSFISCCVSRFKMSSIWRECILWENGTQGRIQKFWSGAEGDRAWGGGVPLPTGSGAWGWGSAPSPKNFGFCISNGDFWCILGAIFYSLDARFTHIKSSAFDLKSAAKFTNWRVLSSRSTDTANDTNNSLMTDDTYYVVPLIFFSVKPN